MAALPPFGVEEVPAPIFSSVRTDLFGPRRNLVSAVHADGQKVVISLDETGELLEVVCFDLEQDAEGLHPVDLDSLPSDEKTAYEELVALALLWYQETADARPPEPQPMDDALRDAMREALNEVGYTGG
jgi:hypothetical protein